MSEHTPGPWTWGEYFQGLYGSGKDNEVLEYFPCEGMFLEHNRREANARLIAAAPDLLEALKGALGSLLYVQYEYGDQVGGWGVRDDRIRKAREAITKATGQS
jgi:hypothetical protein